MDNYKLQHMDIDLCRPIAEKNVGLIMGSGDSQANQFTVSVKKDGATVDLTGCKVIGYLIMPNDETLKLNGTVTDNMACVTVPKSGCVYDGAFQLAIKISVSGNENTVALFVGKTARTVSDTIGDTEKKIYDAAEVLKLIDSMEQAEADAKAATQAAYDAIAAVNDKVNEAGTAIVNTASGNIVSITDGAARPAVELISHIEPVQAGSGDPSPDNVRTISGWNKAIVQGAGKNLLPNGATTQTINGITFTVNADGSVTINGTATANAYFQFAETVYLVAGANVILDSGSTNTDVGLQLYWIRDENTPKVTVTSQGKPIAYPVEASGSYMGYIKIVSGVTVSNVTVYPMLRFKAETDASYEPGNTETMSADLPETVYGGTLDWTTGVLTVDRAIVDAGTLPWRTWNSCFLAYIAGKTAETDSDSVCEIYPHGSQKVDGIFDITNPTSKQNVYIRDTSIAYDAAVLKEKLTGSKISYKLAKPYTIQLTPQQMNMLKGLNNVWSTTGNTDLTYVADTKIYIDQKLAAIAAAYLQN